MTQQETIEEETTIPDSRLFGISEMWRGERMILNRECEYETAELGGKTDEDEPKEIKSALLNAVSALHVLDLSLREANVDSPYTKAARALLLCAGTGARWHPGSISHAANANQLVRDLHGRAEEVENDFDNDFMPTPAAHKRLRQWWQYQCDKMDRWQETADDCDEGAGEIAGKEWKAAHPSRSLPDAFSTVLRACREQDRSLLTEELAHQVVAFFTAESIDTAGACSLEPFAVGFAWAAEAAQS